MSPSLGRVVRSLVALAALALLAVAALPVVAPGTVDPPPVQALTDVVGGDAGSVALGAGVLLGLLLVVFALLPSGSPDDGPFERLRERPPEAVTAAAEARAGAAFDHDFSRATATGGESMDAVRSRLRAVVTDAYAREAGLDPETARERVEDGDWTEDQTARAFLATGADVTPSFLSRVRLWLDPRAERERRVRATVAELTALVEGPEATAQGGATDE